MLVPRTIFGLALVVGLVALSAGGNLGAADKAGEKKADKKSADAKAGKDDAKPSENLYKLPEGGVKELMAFIDKVRTFRPATAEEAVEHREKALPALKAAAEKVMKIATDEDRKLEGFDGVTSLLWAIRANEARLAPPEVQKKLIDDLKAYIASRPKPSQQDLGVIMQVTTTLEYGPHPELAAEAYRELGAALVKSKDPEAVKIGGKMEGAARRLSLLGNPLELSGTLMDGAKFDWAKYRGKVVLVDFWATWCGPCKAELPNVKKNYEAYHDKGFEVVGISLDDDRAALEEFLEKEQNPWITLHDGGWEQNANATYYGVMGIPTVILVDKEGKVVSANARGPELGSQLAKLLGEPKPAAKDKSDDDSK